MLWNENSAKADKHPNQQLASPTSLSIITEAGEGAERGGGRGKWRMEGGGCTPRQSLFNFLYMGLDLWVYGL